MAAPAVYIHHIRGEHRARTCLGTGMGNARVDDEGAAGDVRTTGLNDPVSRGEPAT